jgi:hypothetical protein
MGLQCGQDRDNAYVYTLDSPLRIPDVKNMGKDFAPEELRISHDCPMGHEHQRKFWIFRCKNVKILEKSRAARAKDDRFDHRYRDFAN